MSIRARQFFFAILAALFIISAPLVILYATGYRYNFKKKLIEKTGSLVLDSAPKKARVLINGEDARKITPARFARLLPDDYRIRMEKTGYHPWEKTLPVTSKHTTFATDVTLFKIASPETVWEGRISKAAPSPDGGKIAIISPGAEDETKSDDRLIAFSLSKPEPKIIFSLAKTRILDALWSPDGENILIKTEGAGGQRFFIVNPASGEQNQINMTAKQAFSELVWGTRSDILFGTVKKNNGYAIYKLNPRSAGPAELLGLGGAAIYSSKQSIYTIAGDKNGSRLLELAADKAASPREILRLRPGKYKFLPSPENILTVVNEEEPRMYVISPSAEDPVILEERAHIGSWSPSDKKLIITDNFELQVFEPELNHIKFITRYGKQIKKALWIDSEAQVVLQFDDSILGLELDSRGERYSPTLAEAEMIFDLFFSKDGETAYFVSGEREMKLFKLLIQ
ncbi:PEGA domain-containing protein [Candidatus Uhrbacteria bacterium]|nr:PEGA domain-containing protein [Candidatus Uhrbacteria bacterium]